VHAAALRAVASMSGFTHSQVVYRQCHKVHILMFVVTSDGFMLRKGGWFPVDTGGNRQYGFRVVCFKLIPGDAEQCDGQPKWKGHLRRR
jgi:hypothetical protein